MYSDTKRDMLVQDVNPNPSRHTMSVLDESDEDMVAFIQQIWSACRQKRLTLDERVDWVPDKADPASWWMVRQFRLYRISTYPA